MAEENWRNGEGMPTGSWPEISRQTPEKRKAVTEDALTAWKVWLPESGKAANTWLLKAALD
jgi:hypothetical protein